MSEMRLQRYLAMAGIASRRKAEELITAGMVTVNGVIVTELGTKVTENDEVSCSGRMVKISSEKIYIMLNKPAEYITSVKDQYGRKTVLDLLDGVKGRVYPVGRLDYNTTGLLLLTDDGDLTNKLMHPSNHIEKKYTALVKGTPSHQTIIAFSKGIELDDGITAPAKLTVLRRLKEDSIVEITIHEGRNRQVKRMCKAVGHPVITLKRISIGPLSLGDLKEGQWRYLTSEELSLIRIYISIEKLKF